MWRTREDAPAVRIGHHTDYVKRLAYSPHGSFVASAGLDRCIQLWDVREGRERPRTVMKTDKPSASVYALACNPAGTVLVSGSPEKIVRVWDPRTPTASLSSAVLRLQGHADNIRDLLVSDDGRWVISASSDTTVKVWSLAMASRCHTTFTHFDDAVWCLASCSPTLDTFWAGSRDGFVTKTSRTPVGRAAEDCAESVVICREDAPVVRIAAMEDAFIWTATPRSHVNRWRDVTFSARPTTPFGPVGGKLVIPKGAIIQHTPPAFDDSASVMSARASVFSIEATGTHLVSGTAGGAAGAGGGDVDLDDQHIEPLWREPDGTIAGAPGITKFALLNNRRSVVTLDTSGEVVLWDIVRCCRLKSFGASDFDKTVQAENTGEWVANWCTIDTKSGALTVHLEEGRCYDGEVYHDELGIAPPPQNEDQRINIARWVLTYLLLHYARSVFPGDPSLRQHFAPAMALTSSMSAQSGETVMSMLGGMTLAGRQTPDLNASLSIAPRLDTSLSGSMASSSLGNSFARGGQALGVPGGTGPGTSAYLGASSGSHGRPSLFAPIGEDDSECDPKTLPPAEAAGESATTQIPASPGDGSDGSTESGTSLKSSSPSTGPPASPPRPESAPPAGTPDPASSSTAETTAPLPPLPAAPSPTLPFVVVTPSAGVPTPAAATAPSSTTSSSSSPSLRRLSLRKSLSSASSAMAAAAGAITGGSGASTGGATPTAGASQSGGGSGQGSQGGPAGAGYVAPSASFMDKFKMRRRTTTGGSGKGDDTGGEASGSGAVTPQGSASASPQGTAPPGGAAASGTGTAATGAAGTAAAGSAHTAAATAQAASAQGQPSAAPPPAQTQQEPPKRRKWGSSAAGLFGAFTSNSSSSSVHTTASGSPAHGASSAAATAAPAAAPAAVPATAAEADSHFAQHGHNPSAGPSAGQAASSGQSVPGLLVSNASTVSFEVRPVISCCTRISLVSLRPLDCER
nr:hypothetical protein HK105_006646 [Polyrhizophydium stewartii]